MLPDMAKKAMTDMLLALDTSTTFSGLACCDESGLIGECAWLSGRNHTVQVLPQLDMLLRHIGRTPSDVKAVVVALGPGSWSGLRVGLSIAKGLAFAANVAFIGVCTLDALAYQHQRPFLPVYPLIHLGRGRFATALFQHDGSQWKRQDDYRSVSLPDLCAEINDQAFFCGDIDADVQEQLQRGMNGQASFPTAEALLRRPGYLALLGWQRFVAGERDDPATLEPIYMGEPIKTPSSPAS